MKTKHRNDCSRVFKNYDLKCSRCQELAAGAPAREGWGALARKYDGHVDYAQIKKSPCCTERYGVNINPGGYCNVCGQGRDFS